MAGKKKNYLRGPCWKYRLGAPPPRFKLSPGDRVIKNPNTWAPNAFDAWGRGIGVGVVVEWPWGEGDPQQGEDVDVRWPRGRCFESARGLLPVRKL